jgi:hypothetical protein
MGHIEILLFATWRNASVTNVFERTVVKRALGHTMDQAEKTLSKRSDGAD